MAKRRKGKKKKTTKIDNAEEDYKNAPHSFVFQRGHVGKNVKQLVHDMRVLMEPFTAKNLQVRRKNVLKDFVNIAGVLHVSHFIILTKTEMAVNLRLCRLPRGPTMTFKVHNYCLTKDVIASLKKPNLEQVQYLYHPLLVMNNFSSDEKHIKLMGSMFQNMFPSINVHKVKLNEVRRCVMVSYNAETKMIDFRHYNIKVVPTGLSRGVKKLAQSKIPDLGKYHDISDFINNAGYQSESEGELDGPMNEVVLPQEIKSRGNIKAAKSAVRMTELGPRMTLQLVKIEEGVCNGTVLYHEFITKTEAELAAQKRVKENKRKLKEARKRQQAENIKKKEEDKEAHKEKSIAGMKRKLEEDEEVDDEVEKPELSSEDDADDDVAYYTQEVGHVPDADAHIPTKRLKSDRKPFEKRKFTENKTPTKNAKSFGKKNNQFSKQTENQTRSRDKLSKGKDFKNRKHENNDKEGGAKKKKKLSRSEMTVAQKLIDKKKKKEKIKEKKLKKFKK